MLAEQAARLGVERIGFEAHQVTVRATSASPRPWRPRALVACDEEVERVRWVKDDEELELLRSAQAVTDQAFDVLDSLAVG